MKKPTSRELEVLYAKRLKAHSQELIKKLEGKPRVKMMIDRYKKTIVWCDKIINREDNEE